MAEIHGDVTFTLDGSSSFTIGGETFVWSGRFTPFVGIHSEDVGSNFTANVILSGSSWTASTLQFTSFETLTVNIGDSASGSGRLIENIILLNDGVGNITLKNTTVGSITADEGVDNLTLGLGSVRSIDLGGGDNTLESGSGSVDVLQAGDGDDVIEIGSGGVNSITVRGGDNSVTTGSGFVDTIVSTTGNDAVVIGAGGALLVNVGSGQNSVDTKDFVNSIVAYQGMDTITVSSVGVGSVSAGDGNNVISVSGEADSIVCGNGDDHVTIGAGPVGSIKLGGGSDFLTTTTGFVEFINTGAGGDWVKIGGGSIHAATMGEGDDVLNVSRSSANLEMFLRGDAGRDSISFATFTQNLVLSLSKTDRQETGSGIFFVDGFEILTGGKGKDVLTGNDSENLLHGGAGSVADTLIGGEGADQLNGGGGIDTASYTGATAGVVASLLDPTVNTGAAEGDTYIMIEALTGTKFADTLVGDDGGNTLSGGAGNDILEGGLGDDKFRFNTALNNGSNVDTILDFSRVPRDDISNNDQILLDNAIFTVLPLGTLDGAAFRAHSSGVAGDSSDRIIFETDTGKLFYDADGTGQIAPINFAEVNAHIIMSSPCFLVY